MAKTEIKMAKEPVVHLFQGKTVYEEYLCRPTGMSVGRYFDVADVDTLWERERACIEKALSMQAFFPKLINITLDSLPFLAESDFVWDGGIEIVEWNLSGKPPSAYARIPSLIQKLKSRGLEVWVDDLTEQTYGFWKWQDVTGFKVHVDEIKQKWCQKFLQEEKRPIIVEGVETEREFEQLTDSNVLMAQGYLFFKEGVYVGTQC
ncbi:EAL domain protein [Caldalkalibacillus thermarum TA2.A1]|uniref:EAL domain protein n=1 Tax=Caldalkalibacillus thermarum (strain TA2.A1) TaxID=986075 RepID=F5L4G6_CALTT|nr:EAL domain-containing protein [Caldalkalibacillus thermarum]EGL83777.1 EAL domain protein [Caldalkalibacillus thermarum TA2.A1]QZT33709.1 EAL domain-containing protein [Caldalkalibacillus thermarum TA2.A1]